MHLIDTEGCNPDLQDLSALVTQITNLQNMTGQLQNPNAHQQEGNTIHGYVP